MKINKAFIILCIIFNGAILNSQTIKRISAYDNNYDDNSGIFGITDHAVYEYSWYYDEWLQLPNNGLSFDGDQAIINEISAFDANSHNPSGIYVISDTAVFVYNYYSELWYPLYNTGLCRIEGIVQLSDLSAHYDLEDDYERIYVKSCDHIYYYNWYLQNWSQLPNTGLSEKKIYKSTYLQLNVFPNPIINDYTINLNLPENYSGRLRIAIFNENGEFMKEFSEELNSVTNYKIDLSGDDFTPGLYFYEISGKGFTQAKRIIKL
ncbi:MAG TPA: T9SS type A sorting domain-containing protein [Bacteroidales bacterium]|nr:T9SS type A sorting domain-containing protein [Bacteroidales bacterium]